MVTPLPSVVVVFVQRVKANGRRGACGGLGWGIVGFFAVFCWDGFAYNTMFLQAQGKGKEARDGGRVRSSSFCLGCFSPGLAMRG